MPAGCAAERHATKDRTAVLEPSHVGEAGPPHGLRIVAVLDENRERMVERSADGPVGCHVDVVRMDVGDDHGVHAGKDLGARQGQLAAGHDDVQRGGVDDLPLEAALAEGDTFRHRCEPGVDEKFGAAEADPERGISNLVDLHGPESSTEPFLEKAPFALDLRMSSFPCRRRKPGFAREGTFW